MKLNVSLFCTLTIIPGLATAQLPDGEVLSDGSELIPAVVDNSPSQLETAEPEGAIVAEESEFTAEDLDLGGGELDQADPADEGDVVETDAEPKEVLISDELLSYLSPEERELHRLEQLEEEPIPFYRVKLGDAISVLADMADMNFTAPSDDRFDTEITYRGSSSPYQLLRNFSEQYRFRMEFRHGGWVFYVPNIEETILREYKLRYNTLEVYDIEANDLNASLSESGGGSGGGSVDMQSIEVQTETLVEEVQRMLSLPVDGLKAQYEVAYEDSPTSLMSGPTFKSYLDRKHFEASGGVDGDNYVFYSRPNNKLIVNATRQQHERVEHLLSLIDQPSRLVQIEVVLVETSNNPISDTGFDWSGVSGGNVSLNTSPIQAFGSWTDQYRDTVTLNTSDMEILWNFISSDSDAKVVQSPTGITLNKEEIQLSAVVQTPIVTSSGISSSESISTDTFEVQYIDIGTTLVAIPQILEGDGFGESDAVVNLNFTLSVSTRSGTTIIEDNEFPQLTTRQYVNRVIVPNNHTLAIGGLNIDEAIDAESGVPILQDIPGVGRFFKTKSKDRLQRNLIAFITPRIIETKADSLQINPALEDQTPSLSTVLERPLGAPF